VGQIKWWAERAVSEWVAQETALGFQGVPIDDVGELLLLGAPHPASRFS
jgi:hypothetical protein